MTPAPTEERLADAVGMVAPVDLAGRRLGDWKRPRPAASEYPLHPSLEVIWTQGELAGEGKVTALVTTEGKLIPLVPAAFNLFTTQWISVHIFVGKDFAS